MMECPLSGRFYVLRNFSYMEVFMRIDWAYMRKG